MTLNLIDTRTNLAHGDFESLDEAISAAYFDHICDHFEVLDAAGNVVYGFTKTEEPSWL